MPITQPSAPAGPIRHALSVNDQEMIKGAICRAVEDGHPPLSTAKELLEAFEVINGKLDKPQPAAIASAAVRVVIDAQAGGIKLTEEDLNAIRSSLFSALFDGDPPKITRAQGEYWLARTAGDGNVFMQRFCSLSKTPIESYRHASGDTVLMDLAAISLGYQPPRVLHRLDIPVAETPRG